MSTTEPTGETAKRQGRPLPGAAEAYYAHGCGGTILWDLSGGFCLKCHAEGLDLDDVEQREPVTEPTAGPSLVCPGCGNPDVDLRHGLLCRTCAATVAGEAGDV